MTEQARADRLPHLDVDPEVRACYVQVARGVVHRTVEAMGGVLIDTDWAGRVVGVEVLLPGAARTDQESPKEGP